MLLLLLIYSYLNAVRHHTRSMSDTHIYMTSHTAHTFSVMRSQDACDRWIS